MHESARASDGRFWALAAVIALGAIAAVATGRLDPHHSDDRRAAVQVAPRGAEERAFMFALADDVWSEDVAADDPVVVVLRRSHLDRLRDRGVPHRVVVDDIAADAEHERQRLALRRPAAAGTDWFAEYRDGGELAAFMTALAAQHPDLAQLHSLGSSLEGRPIHALELSRGGKLGIVLDGGHHAREWLSVMVPICIADRLARGAASDPRIRRILGAVRFYVVPLVNPDGYHHSWTVDRYWRKNRRGGHGVDLNRNYSVAWGQAGSSADKQSSNYRGERAFSEPETQAMRALFQGRSIAAHIDFHSFSQVIVYPWSYQRAEPADRDKLAAIADRMSSAMHAAHDQRYAIRPGSTLTIGASGTAGDWSYGERGALSFLVELRPSRESDGGFVLPPEQIAPTCDESLAGVLAVADWIIAHADPRGELRGDGSSGTTACE